MNRSGQVTPIITGEIIARHKLPKLENKENIDPNGLVNMADTVDSCVVVVVVDAAPPGDFALPGLVERLRTIVNWLIECCMCCVCGC